MSLISTRAQRICATVFHFSLFLLPVLMLRGENAAGLWVVAHSDATGVKLSAVSYFNQEATVTVQCKLVNMSATPSLPATVDSTGKMTFDLVHLRIINPALHWSYNFTYHWKPGARRAAITNKAIYQLPFPIGERHRVMQGNFGKFSHYAGSQDEYAVDWEAPPGSSVCAARDGVVTGVRQDSIFGGASPKFKSAANYIVIKHDDGTFAEYLHLQPRGALVKLGERVEAGQVIGLSGSTGMTTQPHIHFAVFQTVDGYRRVTLPSRYQTPAGIISNLEQGKFY